MLKNDTVTASDKAIVTAAQLTEARADIKASQAGLKDVIKLATERGINLPALEWVMKVEKSGKFLEADQFIRDVILYRRAFGSGVSRDQIDFFNLLDVELPLDERAHADGFVAGAFNKDQSNNPHDLSTAAGQMWISGWHDGQAKRAQIQKEEDDFKFEHIQSGDNIEETEQA